MRTRLAPTPSGFLHVGNVVNFLLTSWWAQHLGLEVGLRVDDSDVDRYRPEYADDIFRVLRLMDIPWEFGPTSTDSLLREFSQRDRTDYYRMELESAVDRGLAVYRCGCSRGDAASGVLCTCRDNQNSVPQDAPIRLDASCLPDHDDLGCDGTTLWRRDDQPSYHLVSIVTDRDLQITHIMRGNDLFPSSRLQQALAPFFNATALASAEILHHDLITAPDGSKLSKSAGARGRPLSLDASTTSALREHAVRVGADLGVTDPRSAADTSGNTRRNNR